MKRTIVLLFLLLVTACSPIMEFNRPTPVDMDEFVIGEPRATVVESLGAPVATVPEGDKSCDVYKLYTKGVGSTSRALIGTGELIADIFTLGLAELIFTPTEIGTKNRLHSVTFCYGKDGKLATLKSSN
jgi:hypothetical protein